MGYVVTRRKGVTFLGQHYLEGDEIETSRLAGYDPATRGRLFGRGYLSAESTEGVSWKADPAFAVAPAERPVLDEPSTDLPAAADAGPSPEPDPSGTSVIDPDSATIAEVQAWVSTHGYASEVLEAERTGKARTGLLTWLDSWIAAETDTDPDQDWD